jgi:hypothetical protein
MGHLLRVELLHSGIQLKDLVNVVGFECHFERFAGATTASTARCRRCEVLTFARFPPPERFQALLPALP